MEDQKALEVQNMPRGDVPAIADNSIIELARQAEQRLDAIVKMKQVALKVTNKHDWTNQGGKPYLQVSGSEKVARLFGISWRIDEPIKEFLEGGHFMFTYRGEFSLSGATIEVIGVRASNDPFFSQKTVWTNNKPEKIAIPPSEIDVGDVKKAALTNCLGNGITRLLGIRNLTWEEVQSYSGVKKEDVAGVEYKTKKGKDSPNRAPSEHQEAVPEGGYITDEEAGMLRKYAQDLKIPPLEVLKRSGASSFDKIPAEKVKELIAWLDEQAQPAA